MPKPHIRLVDQEPSAPSDVYWSKLVGPAVRVGVDDEQLQHIRQQALLERLRRHISRDAVNLTDESVGELVSFVASRGWEAQA